MRATTGPHLAEALGSLQAPGGTGTAAPPPPLQGAPWHAPQGAQQACQQVAPNLDDLADAPAPNFIAFPARPGRFRPRRRLMGEPWTSLEDNRRCILLTAVRVACSKILGFEGSRKPNSKLQDTWQVPVEPLA